MPLILVHKHAVLNFLVLCIMEFEHGHISEFFSNHFIEIGHIVRLTQLQLNSFYYIQLCIRRQANFWTFSLS